MKRSVLAVVAAAILCLAGLPAQVGSASGSAPRITAAAPGLAGTPIVLAPNGDLKGYDIAMGPDGTAYVGWIAANSVGGDDRTVYLCELPKGATSCQALASTPSLGGNSAAGLQVLPPTATEDATLVWFHDTANSINGPLEAKIATAIYSEPDGALSEPADRAAAYSFGSLETAERGPGGAIWAVLKQSPGAGDNLRILPGLTGTPKVINPPWLVGKARLAFASGKAVLVFEQYGPITERVREVHQTSTGWSSINSIPGTWNLGGAFDVANQGGVRLVAAVNNASYSPRIATWTGSAFGTFTYTGDKNSCAPASHDLFPDASGRLADVAYECGKVTIANHPKARTGAFVRFSAGGTTTGEPQIGTSPRGLGWVAWSRQSSTAQALLVAPIRLPAQKTSNSNGSTYGVVTVSGPVSCLPAVQTSIGVSASGRNGWSLVSKALKLDGSLHSTGLNGALLAAGSTHTVTGSAKFRKNGVTRSLSASLTFKACPNP
jgi:hypothetical protein